MEYLLDTHVFLWWSSDDPALGPTARAAIAAAESLVLVSAATAWEIATKRALGKLDSPADIAAWVAESGFGELPIDIDHAVRSAELPKHHRDPFDRMLIAQAQIESLILVTSEVEIEKYGVATLDAAA